MRVVCFSSAGAFAFYRLDRIHYIIHSRRRRRRRRVRVPRVASRPFLAAHHIRIGILCTRSSPLADVAQHHSARQKHRDSRILASTAAVPSFHRRPIYLQRHVVLYTRRLLQVRILYYMWYCYTIIQSCSRVFFTPDYYILTLNIIFARNPCRRAFSSPFVHHYDIVCTHTYITICYIYDTIHCRSLYIVYNILYYTCS